MDQMTGKWRNIPERTENFDAFAAAIKYPAELTAKIKEMDKNVVVELSRNGDVYTIEADVSGIKDTLTFRLGEQFTSNGFGIKSQNKFIEDGDMVLGEHIMNGQTTTSKRYLKDGHLHVELTVHGVTTTNVMQRC